MVKHCNMRTLQLTHQEIDLITRSLEFLYGSRLDIITQNKYLLSDTEKESIIANANVYAELQEKINSGEKDV